VVVTRSEPSARRAVRFIGDGKACAGMTRRILASRVILIATPDDEIAVVAQELARIGEEELRGRVVLHTSGAMDSAVLDAVHERGAMVGSMHPLQSFSGVSVPSLEGKVFTIERETQAVRVARQIARSLGGLPVRISGSKKILYHTSGDGRRSCARGGGSRHAIAPLAWDEAERSRARQVLENFETLGPRAAWTGPLSRGDYKVARAHLEALQESPEEFAQAYEALSHLAARVLAKDPAGVLAELEKTSVEKKLKAKAIGGKG